MVRRLPFLLIALCLSHSAVAEVRLAVSIKPLQMIAAAITGETASITVLIPPAQSPHHFVFRPSDRLALESAELVLWIGPSLETFLQPALDQVRDDQKVIELAALAGLKLLPLRNLGDRPDVSGNAQVDPHLWLDPGNALVIAEALARELTALDPASAGIYQANLESFSGQAAALQQSLGRALTGVATVPYIVYHDAFQYLEAAGGLRPLLALVEDEELQPTMRHIMESRRRIRESAPRCLFLDTGASHAAIDTMLAGQPVQQVTLDILGLDQETTGESYVALVEAAGKRMHSCLSGAAAP